MSAWSETFVVKSDSAEKGSGAVLGCVGVLPAVETTGGGIGAAKRGAGNDEGGAPTAAGGPPGTADAEAEGEGGVGRECEEALLLAAAAAGECESGAEGTDVGGNAGGQPGGTPALLVDVLSVGLG